MKRSFTNPHNVLVDDTASSNVEVTDLRIAHQTLWKTDSGGGSLKFAVVLLIVSKSGHLGRLGVGDSIAILGRLIGGHTPTVNDDCCKVSKVLRGPRKSPGVHRAG